MAGGRRTTLTCEQFTANDIRPDREQDIKVVEVNGSSNGKRRITMALLRGRRSRRTCCRSCQPGHRHGRVQERNIAANGGRIPNLGEKHVKFRALAKACSSRADTRKPLAYVQGREKGQPGCREGSEQHRERADGMRIELTEENGKYHHDVDFLTWVLLGWCGTHEPRALRRAYRDQKKT